MNASDTPLSGCYGKIPVLGDFVTRNLPGRMVETWDEWLQSCMAASRQTLDDSWMDIYLTSPVWCYAAGPGTLDQDTWLGVMIPSVDRVGRYFPFTIALRVGPVNPLSAMHQARNWYREAERLALDCLGDDFQVKLLEERLFDLPAVEGLPETGPDSGQPSTGDETGRHYRLGESVGMNDVLAGLAHDLALELFPAFSVWWTSGSREVCASMQLARGLPAAESFPALLDGRFSERHWIDRGTLGEIQAADEDIHAMTRE